MKNEIKYLFMGIILVLVTFIGVTLAYFIVSIEGDKKDISINTGDLRVIFDNGDAINGEDIEPGWSISKSFSIENKSKTEYKYNLVLNNLLNNFSSDDLVYRITSSSGYNMPLYSVFPKSSTEKNEVIAYNIPIAGKSKHEYYIDIKFIDNQDRNQIEDMGASLNCNLFIEEGTTLSIFPENSLAQTIIENNNIMTRSDFSKNLARTGGIVFKQSSSDNTNDGQFTEDINGDGIGEDVYYYSGDTSTNWVKFGLDKNDNPLYWRIIRINEDGSVRLLYIGTDTTTTEAYIGSSAFNSDNTDPLYGGYMYGSIGSLESNRTNENSSTIKTIIDEWYRDNLYAKGFEKYISKDAIYCNDRSVNGNYDENYLSSTIYYGNYDRIQTNIRPSYKCGGNSNGILFDTYSNADKFSANTSGGGNGLLKCSWDNSVDCPLALMSIDEVSYAGGEAGVNNPYVWYYTNSSDSSAVKDKYWWTMSPNRWESNALYAYYISGRNGQIFVNAKVNFGYVVRPVISLNLCSKVSGGNGKYGSPYEISSDSCN